MICGRGSLHDSRKCPHVDNVCAVRIVVADLVRYLQILAAATNSQWPRCNQHKIMCGRHLHYAAYATSIKLISVPGRSTTTICTLPVVRRRTRTHVYLLRQLTKKSSSTTFSVTCKRMTMRCTPATGAADDLCFTSRSMKGVCCQVLDADIELSSTVSNCVQERKQMRQTLKLFGCDKSTHQAATNAKPD